MFQLPEVRLHYVYVDDTAAYAVYRSFEVAAVWLQGQADAYVEWFDN